MLNAGDWVEVRSKEEILRSLDKQGRLDGLPFMPQMFKFCGKRFEVSKRAHKTCDTVNGTGGRHLPNGVHLDLRCDGEAYAGCQAACLLFWKEAWLKPLEHNGKSVPAGSHARVSATPDRGCTEEDVLKATHHVDQTTGELIYACQATELPSYTTRLRWWNLRQYLEDYTSGNTSLARMLRGAIYALYYNGTQANRDKCGRSSHYLYDRFQELRHGTPFPRRKGKIPIGKADALADLRLQPGELVRIKPYEEILATLDTANKNRGLYFDAEMVPFCGGTYRVRAMVKTFLNEKTGKVTTMKTPAVILDGVWCQARYSDCRMFCPRAIFSWWREAWLERVEEPVKASADQRPARSVEVAEAL